MLTATRARPRSPSAPATEPIDVSVIMPVRDEARHIASVIGALYASAGDSVRFEVLVVDGGSRDETVAIVRGLQARLPNLHLHTNPKRLSGAARNIGVRSARGDLIVVVDGHCELEPGPFLADLVDAFRRSGADCLGRPQPLDVAGASAFQRAVAAARSSPLGHHPDSFVYSDEERFVPPQSVAVAYRREVFEAVGLFDESFDACEDVEFNHRAARAGLSCFFTPRIAVRYHPRATLAGLFRQLARYGRGRVRLLRKHPETFSLGSMAPAVFVAGLILGPAFAALSPLLAALYILCLAAYVGIVGLTSAALALRARSLGILPWLPLVFAAVHVGAGAGLLREWLARPEPRPRPAPRPVWRPHVSS